MPPRCSSACRALAWQSFLQDTCRWFCSAVLGCFQEGRAGPAVLAALRCHGWDPWPWLRGAGPAPLVQVVELCVLQLRFPPRPPGSPAQDSAGGRSQQRFRRHHFVHLLLGQWGSPLTRKQVRLRGGPSMSSPCAVSELSAVGWSMREGGALCHPHVQSFADAVILHLCSGCADIPAAFSSLCSVLGGLFLELR